MTDAATLPATDRCVLMIQALIEVVVGGLNTGLSGPVIIRLWNRLTHIAVRLASVRFRPIRPRGTPRPMPVHQRQQRPQPPQKPRRLPTANAWLVKLLPETQPYAAQLQSLLAEPEMAAMLDANPGLRRLLRPFCRMLGVKPVQPVRPVQPVQPVPSPPEPLPPRREPSAAPKAPPVQRDPRPTEPAPHPASPAPNPRPKST